MSNTSFLLAITGPAGSGKSTAAGQLAKQIERCVNIDADVVKHMIVNSFVYDFSPAGTVQWELLGTNIGMLAKNFQTAGYNVIINGYINEPAWVNIQKHVTLTHKILLLPHLDSVTKRDVSRHPDVQMGADAIKRHHAYFSSAQFYDDFVKLDSTAHGEAETVNAILEIIQK